MFARKTTIKLKQGNKTNNRHLNNRSVMQNHKLHTGMKGIETYYLIKIYTNNLGFHLIKMHLNWELDTQIEILYL